jgi:cathepsin L
VLVCIAVAFAKPKWNELEGYTFERYLADFHKSYTHDEFQMRKQIFERKLDAILKHNNDTTKTWKNGVNKMTDWTEEEFNRLLGYKMHALPERTKRTPFDFETPHALPTTVDWRTKGIITAVMDQGGCGSCWTFGTAETIESFYAMKYGVGNLPVLSEQQIVDCTPNPNDCGGTGGCGGGTPELAMAQIMQTGGLTSEADYPYVGEDQTCQYGPNTPPIAKLSSYTNLISNNYSSVLTAVALIGPMIISVDASSWGGYSDGVFDGCDQQNPDLDHVVQLVGYGTDTSAGDYWLVRNSWSEGWGENGYIRLRRTSTLRCGTDTNPQDGTGCNGGPPTVTVCGTCGLLYDVLYPVIA